MFKKKIQIENTVRKLRFNNDEMTQQQLAEEVGVSRQTIVAIEKYKYTPSLDLAFKIALASAILNAKSNDGVYLYFSMATIVCRETPTSSASCC